MDSTRFNNFIDFASLTWRKTVLLTFVGMLLGLVLVLTLRVSVS